MQTNPAVEHSKNINWSRVHGISPVGEEKVCGGKDLPKSQVLSSERKTEWVWEGESGDSEDGEEDDDELPCVIGESEGDCTDEACEDQWLVLSIDRGAAYRKERLVILKGTGQADEQDWL